MWIVGAHERGGDVSFLRIEDCDTACLNFHGGYKGSMAVDVELSDGFAMVEGAPLFWPPPRRGIPRREQRAKAIGVHYSLVPSRADMPMARYAAEVERIKSGMAAAAGVASASGDDDEARPGPADWLEPSEGLMVWVAYALRALSEAQAEPASARSIAWFVLASICAADTSFGELLSQPDMAAWALAAMEQYEPPHEDDPVADSDCWHIELRLREALKVRALGQVQCGL